MENNRWLTLKEAIKQTGKSYSTIYRAIKSEKVLVRSEKLGENPKQGFRYLIFKESLFKTFPPESRTEKVFEPKVERPEEVSEKALELRFENAVLKERVKTKEREKQRLELNLTALKDELKERDQKIFEVSHSAGILRGQIVEMRKLLEAPKKKPSWKFWR